MRHVFRLWPTPPRAHRDEGAHDADASQRQANRSGLTLQGGRIVKGGAEELQHPVFVSGHDRVAGGVWYGEVQDIIRVRHHGTLDLIANPAPIGGGETRLPDQWGVAHSRKFPTRRFPQRSFLRLAGTFDDREVGGRGRGGDHGCKLAVG